MKTKQQNHKRLFFVLLITSLGLIYSSVQGQNCLSPAGEATFNITPHERTVNDATTAIAAFQDHFRLKSNNSTFNRMAAEIQKEDLCQLRDDAIAVQAVTSNCSKYITALNIILGMDNNNTIELIYQPMILCFTGTSTVGSDCYEDYEPHKANIYYKYTNNAFVPIQGNPQDEVNANALRYQAAIKITHFVGDTQTDFMVPVSDTDILGDVLSVMYSFREIDIAINSNNSATLRIFNDMRTMDATSSGGSSALRKHSLILAGDQSDGVNTKKNVKENFIYSGFYDPGKGIHTLAAYLNLAHLCPPNCPSLKFLVSCP